MISVFLMLIGATLAGGLVPLLAARFREGGLHLLVAASAGLVLGAFLFHLAPEFFDTVDGSGGGSLAGLVLGFALMAAWGFFRSRRVDPDSDPHGRVWLSALLGMSVHAVTAGVGLALFFRSGALTLILGPILWHKATEGLSLSSLLQLSGKGPWKTILYLALFSLATPIGMLLGMVGIGDEVGFTAGLAAGSFLYVVVFDFLPEAFHGAGSRALRGVALTVGLLAGAIGTGSAHDGGGGEAAEHADSLGVSDILGEGWHVLTQMSPWLLGGFLIAGVLSQVLDAKRIGRWLGKGGIRSVVGAALVGAPLPLCSCSVLPVASSLRKEGASRGATSAFLISTPETGVDSISVTWGLLGPLMAVARLVSSVLTAIVTGFAVELTPGEEEEEPIEEASLSDCCMHEEEGGPEEEGEHADHSHGSEGGVASRILRYAYVDMMDDLAETLLLGLALAALAAALLPSELLSSAVMTGPGAYVLMLVVGVPLYVCASASTPIAAALLAKGLSPGAALVFLLAGPATNLATLAVLRKTLGGRAAVVHLCVLAVTTLAFGWAVDAWLFDEGSSALVGAGGLLHAHGQEQASVLGSAAALVLLALIGASLWRGARAQDSPALGAS